MSRKGETMVKVPYGQDPYCVIGKYIWDHISTIEDLIVVIEVDNIITKQLFMVDMNAEYYFIWYNDWYEGEKAVALIDFFPVSEAINPSAQPERKRGRWIAAGSEDGYWYKCSECGKWSDWEDPFCRECGAKMERGEQE